MKNSLDLNKYICSICQLVYEEPIKLKDCEHCFCKECIKNCIKSQINNDASKKTYQCPLCRVDFKKKDMIANTLILNKLKKDKIVCGCNQEILLIEYNKHVEDCSFHTNTIKESIKETKVKDVRKSVNRSTFTCPVCQMKNLDRKGLLDHVKNNHPHSTAVCPICLSQPWGDPNYTTQLNGHLKLRHMFDYDTTVDYNNEEDDVLAQVLKESLNDK